MFSILKSPYNRTPLYVDCFQNFGKLCYAYFGGENHCRVVPLPTSHIVEHLGHIADFQIVNDMTNLAPKQIFFPSSISKSKFASKVYLYFKALKF